MTDTKDPSQETMEGEAAEEEEEEEEGKSEVMQSAATLKAFLMKNSTKTNMNVYDHLTQLLMKVMDEQPNDAVDVIEDLSHDVKRSLYVDKQSTLQDVPQATAAEQLAEQQRLLFSHTGDTVEEEEEEETPLPNISEIGFFLEHAGVGLGREELQRIYLALKQLVESQELVRCRLWGKILGVESSYIVAEVESKELEEEEEEDGEREEEEGVAEPEEGERDQLPQSTYKPPPAVPKEIVGTGANKFLYYVCKEPGLPWVKLPSVTPAQITVARQIRKFFTGKMDAPIESYPPFPGNEANYLRAQIARIAAGTHVSPQGFFLIMEEEDDEEGEATQDSYDVNNDFEGIPPTEMAESLSTWVHHVQHVLPQGRCTWLNLALKAKEEADEDEEVEEPDEEPDEPEPEVGPPLLTPLSQDAEVFNTPPWTSKLSSILTSQHAAAVLRSNLWPGAFAYACGKKFENIYVGWGLKNAGDGYSPPVPPVPQKEYVGDEEITEAKDPSAEEERALQEALAAQEEDLEDSEDEEESDEADY
ncbi:radial spoke head protein 4 homolog A-like isoform X2 [Solea solea]|uniref:radial spoke head protein 4 homolog A-like isoform X2 n=1 Tax=Solea solea TaxID=90069 RepID=UPI00272DBDC7|nr:radial spoke head protein 4 homolog A-like isoform X2 [Solea solea]